MPFPIILALAGIGFAIGGAGFTSVVVKATIDAAPKWVKAFKKRPTLKDAYLKLLEIASGCLIQVQDEKDETGSDGCVSFCDWIAKKVDDYSIIISSLSNEDQEILMELRCPQFGTIRNGSIKLSQEMRDIVREKYLNDLSRFMGILTAHIAEL